MKCSNCQNELNPGAKFCTICGTSTEQPAQTIANICPFCGKELRQGASFCNFCGKNISAKIEYAPAQNVVPVMEKNPHTEKSGGKIALIIVLAVLLTVAIGIAVFAITALVMGNKNNEAVAEKEIVVIVDDKNEEKEEIKVSDTTPYVSSDTNFFPSNTQYITASDLVGKSQHDVAMIRNEIYARHGYIFKTEPYKSYFNAQPWYVADPYFSEDRFNAIEKANKDFLVEYEKSRGWR